MTSGDQLVSLIGKYSPCPPGVGWLRLQQSAAQTWQDCPNASWMIWYIVQVIRPAPFTPLWQGMILACCQIARTVLFVVPPGDDRPRRAIEATENYVQGTATIEHVKDAYDAAIAAYSAAGNASHAVLAALAVCAYGAALAIGRPRIAATNASAAATAVGAYAARKEHADIIRQFMPIVPSTLTLSAALATAAANEATKNERKEK